MILIGANDVTHAVPPAVSVRHLREGVRRLREAGVEVVVGTCPDLGTLGPVPPPLKQVARFWSRKMAAAQTVVVIEQGGRTVSLGPILGPEFAAAPALLFGPDQFHPSADGYRSVAAVLLPSVLAALRLVPSAEISPAATSRRGRAADRGGCGPGGPDAGHRARRNRGRRLPPRRTRPLGRDAASAPGAAGRSPGTRRR